MRTSLSDSAPATVGIFGPKEYLVSLLAGDCEHAEESTKPLCP